MTIPQAFDLAFQHQRAGRMAEAEGIYRQILGARPNHADALHMLGILAHQGGRREAALDLIRQAIAANPASFHYHVNLGNVLSDQGRAEEAITAYRQALQVNPNGVDAHYNLGIALQNQGHLDEAMAAYRAALQARPDFALAHNNLGAALKAKGRLDEAMAAYRKALEISPNYADAHNNLGVVFREKRQFAAAIEAYRRALQSRPNFAEAWHNLAVALQSQGRLDEAVDAYRRALQIKPDCAEALNNLGATLQEQGRFDEALVAFRHALRLKPGCAEMLNNVGTTLKDQGHLDEASACFDEAMGWQPESVLIHSNILALQHYRPGTTRGGLLEAHTAYESLHAAPLRAAWQAHENIADPDRPLRLGFISPHFASHPVGRFLIRPLQNLDATRFHVICYSDTYPADAMTARIQAAAALWRDTPGWTDEELTERIRQDRVDILFDLAGHTAKNRLQVFARKPAPIQITWLDYVGTTGLAAMDYILGDPRQIPPGAERWYREKVLRMPDDYICYDPPIDAPPVGPLPALKNGRLTFASFNIPAKITPQIARVWARILHRIPGSRLMLKNRGVDDPGTVSRFRQMFAEHGIGLDQLDLRGWSPSREVLACYNEVDVGLDTFPYHGGLTTCEAIWMGTPVISCPGETFASRHGLTHLSAAGATETIARDLEEYVELAVGLAGDLPRLAATRAGLRERVAASPLCDGERFSAHFMTILREVWKQWVLLQG